MLGAAAGVGLAATAGCGLFDGDPAPPPPDPLTPLRDEALTLAAAYDRTAADQPRLAARLSPIAQAHRAHAAELDRLIRPPGTSPSAGPTPSATTAVDGVVGVARLRTAERQAMQAAIRACRAAPADRAALIGSIAAARAAHAEALR